MYVFFIDKVMKKLLDLNPSHDDAAKKEEEYIEAELNRLEHIIDSKKVSKEKESELERRVNVLDHFLHFITKGKKAEQSAPDL